MTEIRFYHLQKQSQDQVLPMLLSKAYSQGRKVVVKLSDAAAVTKMNEHLWTFSSVSFLAHGCAKDGNASRQPIWLTDKDENPNDAEVLIICAGTTSEMHGDFTLCCEMLNGHDDRAVQDARARWKRYKEEEKYELTYWQQSEQGAWGKKA